MSNLITIEFGDKSTFPKGDWCNEPDFCHWFRYDYPCLAIRDMTLGNWRGFVGITKTHPFYNKEAFDLLKEKSFLHISIYEGISHIGKLPAKYKKYNPDHWFLGFSTLSSGDLLPLMVDKVETDKNKIVEIKTYKDLHFVRKETNDLAKQLFVVERDNKTL